MSNAKTFITKIKIKVPRPEEGRLRFDDKKRLNDPDFCVNDEKEIEVELKIISEQQYDLEKNKREGFIEYEDGSNMEDLEFNNQNKFKYKKDKFKYLAEWEMSQLYIKDTDPRLKAK